MSVSVSVSVSLSVTSADIMANFALYSMAPDQGGSATSLSVRFVSDAFDRGAYAVTPHFLSNPSGGGLHAAIGVSAAVLKSLSEAPGAKEEVRRIVGTRLTDIETALTKLRTQTVGPQVLESTKRHLADEEKNRAELQRRIDTLEDKNLHCEQQQGDLTRELDQTKQQLTIADGRLKGAQQKLEGIVQEKTRADGEIAGLRAKLEGKREEDVQQAEQDAIAQGEEQEEQMRMQAEQQQLDRYTQAFQQRTDDRRISVEHVTETVEKILKSRTADDGPRAIRVYTENQDRLSAQKKTLEAQLADPSTSREVKEMLRQEIKTIGLSIVAMREKADGVPPPSKTSTGFMERRIAFGNAWRLMLRPGKGKNVDSIEIWEEAWSGFLTDSPDFLPKSKLEKALNGEVKEAWETKGWLEKIAERTDVQKQSQEKFRVGNLTELVDLATLSGNFGDTIKKVFAQTKPSTPLSRVPPMSINSVMDLLLSLDFALERLHQGLDKASSDSGDSTFLVPQAIEALSNLRDVTM